MTALVLTTTTFTLERKKIFGSFFTATNELLLGLVDEKLTSFQYPLAFFASIPHYRSTPLREVSISMVYYAHKAEHKAVHIEMDLISSPIIIWDCNKNED